MRTGIIQSNGRPLLPGDSEIDQQFRIFKAFGTPTTTVWPSLKLANFQAGKFPFWDAPHDVGALVPMLNPDGKDLFKVCFLFFVYS